MNHWQKRERDCESMRVRETDRDRETDTEKEQVKGWFASLLNSSPWLTTLISTLLCPLLIFLLLTQFFSLILSYLTSLIKEQINTVQLMVLRSQYLPLGTLRENL